MVRSAHGTVLLFIQGTRERKRIRLADLEQQRSLFWAAPCLFNVSSSESRAWAIHCEL